MPPTYPAYVHLLLGFYCPEGTGFDLRGCPEGTYGPDPGYWSVSQCRQCDGGHYCSSRNGTAVTGPCRKGYYCSHGNASPQPLSQIGGKHLCQTCTYCSSPQEMRVALCHLCHICHLKNILMRNCGLSVVY